MLLMQGESCLPSKQTLENYLMVHISASSWHYDESLDRHKTMLFLC